MSDELVERLRSDWFGYDVSLKAIDAMEEAADRIEQLTGEVRRWQGMFDEKHNLMLEHKARAEKAEAERDRLREALDETAQILSQCTFETIRVHGQYIDRREAVSRARAALKGGTP